jgi:hypothetical protein
VATGSATIIATFGGITSSTGLTVTPPPLVNTGAVRVIGTVLLITPLPSIGHGNNTIDVLQVPNASAASGSVLEVIVNGKTDVNQPDASTIDSIIAFGAKSGDKMTIDPSVTVAATIDSGHGGHNVLKGGGIFTVEHGWFGHSILIGGPGINELIGRAGLARFRPSRTSILIFAGQPRRRTHNLNPTPPGGTFYRFTKGQLIPVPESDLFPHAVPIQPTPKKPVGGHHKKKH